MSIPHFRTGGSRLLTTILRQGRWNAALPIVSTTTPSSFRSLMTTASAGGTGTCTELVRIDVDDAAGVATLTMNRPPANSLSLEMNQAISTSIKQVENEHPQVNGLILASGHPTIYSAGLDVSELLLRNSSEADRLPRFWHSVQQVFLDLYGSRLATVAAIGGHAPAAGCMLALACDYRIMAATTTTKSTGDGNGDDAKDGARARAPTIGFNETRLGIAAPPWMCHQLERTVGFRHAEKALALGTLFAPREALKIGLVDDVVEKNQLMECARQEAKVWAAIPARARIASKMAMRAKHLQNLELKRDEDTKMFCDYVQRKEVQTGLEAYVESLKKGRKKG